MDNSKFKGYLNALVKEQNTDNILKLLISIRSLVDWPKNINNINEIRGTGSLKHLLNFLQTQQRKHILDVCLSILGNCVMDKICAREMIGVHNALSGLNHVLQRHPKEDSINGRVFRVLGNLCQHKVEWANLVISRKPQIITHLIKLLMLSRTSNKDELKEKYSDATILMAIRSLKYLINQNTVQQLIKNFSVLNAVGSLFIISCQEWKNSQTKTNPNILNALISLIHTFSRYKDYSMIADFKYTTEGNALEQLVNVLLLSPKMVIKIIMNFLSISRLISDLPILNICNKLIEEVVNKDIDSEGFKTEFLDYVKCLCCILDHPANRYKQQCGKTIPALIHVLQKLNKPTEVELECCVLLVNTLNKCQYAEYLVQEQLQSDILDVVIQKLEWIVDNTDITHKHHFKKGQKRKLEFGDGDTEKKQQKRLLDFENEDYAMYKAYYKRAYSYRILMGRRPGWHGISLGRHDPPRANVTTKLCSTCLEPSEQINFDCTMSHGAPSSSPCFSEDSDQSPVSPVSSEEDISYISTVAKYNRSPSPCSSSGSDYAALSWASPCSSPRSLNNDIEVYSDSDDYSPVCSEADSTEYPLNTSIDTEGSVDEDRRSECRETEENVPIEEPLPDSNTNRLKISLIFEIASLIRSYIKIKPPLRELGSEKLLIALLNCSEFLNSKNSDYIATVNLVCDILHSYLYLVPLMKTTFIEKIYDLTQLVHSTQCVICMVNSNTARMVLKKLTVLTQTKFGRLRIGDELHKKELELKEHIVLVIPYIVEDKLDLWRLMLKLGGMEILVRLLKQDSDKKRRTIKALSVLASTKLDIANPKKVAIDLDDNILVYNVQQSYDPVKLVTFKLDDGQCVKADSYLLTENSVYFSGLLNGFFKESTEDEIPLHGVNYKTLNCIINLFGCANVLGNVDIATLLDVIALSDMYLMNDVCSFVTNYVEKHRLSSKTVPVIYKWSLESGLNLLRVESIAYALVANVVDNTRFAMFNDLFNVGYNDYLIDDIVYLFERYLCFYSE